MENLQPRELRIGNLLRDKISKTELKVIGLAEENISTYVIDGDKFPLKNGWEIEPIPLTDKFPLKNGWEIEPIPLTEEWLLKFGFKFRNTNKQYGWYLEVSKNRVLTWCHSKEISLDFDLEDYDYNNTLFDFNCEYIHRLQNLYFALTGTELTIKL
jgi:hypothetical protein